MRRIEQFWMRTVLAGVMGLGPFGCARSAEERQLDSMSEDIRRLQEDRDREDRLSPLGDTESQAPTGAPLGGADPSAPSAPRNASTLESVRMGDGDGPLSDDYADPDEPSPRPRIRISGFSRGRGGPRGDEEVVSSDDEGGPQNPAANDDGVPHPDLAPEAKRAYDAALALVNAKKFDAALEAFAAFLVKWPDHPYADHAMYWRGECYFARGEYARAADQFEGLLARFPVAAKAPDALLKLGLAKERLGRSGEAKECFDRLAQQYPQAEATRHIPPGASTAATRPSEDHR